MVGLLSVDCAVCQSANAVDALYCDECGAALESQCRHCGQSNRASAKFCKKCGNRIAFEAALNENVETNLNASSSLAAGELAGSRGYLAGERKRVTVMFADIRGSTAFIEKLDPEEVRKHFDPVLRVMMDAVHRYGGTVNQVLGDGIMALFGAPMAHEDHAVRACYAALAMQEEMRREGAKKGGGGLRIGIGLNSGEVVVRSMANDLNFDYSALGQTTHLAARMESLARPGAILMTTACAREVEGFVQLKDLGAMQAKGVLQPVEVFELIGATSARTRLQAAAERGLNPFVGRDSEIENFRRLSQTALNHGGQILALFGQPGIGKSRLVRELVGNYLPSQWRVVAATSVSYGTATPYFPIIEMLRNYFSLSDESSVAAIRAKVIAQVRQLDEGLTDTIPPILKLLDAGPSGEATQQAVSAPEFEDDPKVVDALAKFANTEPPERRQLTLDSVRRILFRESHNQPLLVVFEDLHWIDNETQAFLDTLVDSLQRARILLLVNYRIGYKHGWAERAYYHQFRLNPLPADGVEELLGSLLGLDADLLTLKKHLIDRTDGNPFFIEETVRSLVDAGTLIGSKGAYRPGVRLESIGIPGTIQAVLAERIDRLSNYEKQLLQCAAAIGVIVPLSLLRAVAGLPDEQLYRSLATLQAGEFIYQSNLFPEMEYHFTHALTNEVAYGALLHERRVALHGRILGALEKFALERPDDYADALANHAFRGELWNKAAEYQRQAGNRALGRLAFSEALASYRRSFEALGHLPESRQITESQIDLHLDCRNVLFLLGELPRVGEELAHAEELAQRLSDEHRLARVLNFQNGYYGLVGDPQRAIAAGQRAMALSVTRRDLGLLAVSQYYTGVAYNKTAQYERARAILRSGMESVEGALKSERFGTAAILSVIFRSHLSQSLAMTGRFTEALSYATEGITIADEERHPVSQIHVNSSLGLLYLLKGDFAGAISALERALAICNEKHIPIYLPLVAPRLGYGYVNVGRLDEGLSLLEQSMSESANVGRAGFLALNTTWLGESYLAAGRTDEASACAARARELARQYQEPGHGALAVKLCADIAACGTINKIEQSLAGYLEALHMAGTLGMRPLQAHCHAGMGKLYERAGDRRQAQRELEFADELYRAMAMTVWLSVAENRLS